MLTTAAALRGATKHYKTFALGPVDLAVPAGSILGLIGENGAGKTTALKLLCRPSGRPAAAWNCWAAPLPTPPSAPASAWCLRMPISLIASTLPAWAKAWRASLAKRWDTAKI